MSKQVQFRRGSTSEHATFTGAVGEITVNTTTNRIHSHDGVTAGGFAHAHYTEGTFTPTVTLVGGAGNTVPVYSTNTGRYTKIGRLVFVDILLAGDGGAEGAGTGVFTVALPIASSASVPAGGFPTGLAINGTDDWVLLGSIVAGASVITVIYHESFGNVINFPGVFQNNTTRQVRLQFSYEV